LLCVAGLPCRSSQFANPTLQRATGSIMHCILNLGQRKRLGVFLMSGEQALDLFWLR